jgi:DNA-directed RNA polymerase subunit M/transcription elongation factor TFIIS
MIDFDESSVVEKVVCPTCGNDHVVTYRVFTPEGVPLAVWHRCDACGKRWEEDDEA